FSDNALNKLFQNQACIFEVGNDSITQWPSVFKALRRATDHGPCLFANGEHGLRFIVHSDYSRLPEHDSAIIQIDQRICSAEINADFLAKISFEPSHNYEPPSVVR